MLEDLGISVEFSHHEAGPGQNEIDLRYADALTTADNIMTFRTVIKEVAIEQGVYATFMPKPLCGKPGSGMHTHMSLFEGDTNAFYDAGAQYQLSKIGRQFIAGLLRHAPEITAVTNQFVNSYKRLWGGDEAPSFVTLGPQQPLGARARAAVQAQQGPERRASSTARIDSAANPYLAFSLHARRRAQGHRGGLRAAARGRGQRLGAHRRRAPRARLRRRCRRASTTPSSSWRSRELVAETLGEQVFNYVLLNKRQEWQEYRAQVTPFELKSNLEIL